MDNSNPYASPLTSGTKRMLLPLGERLWPNPGVSRALSIGLLLNVLSVVCLFVLAFLSILISGPNQGQSAPTFFVVIIVGVGLWMLFIWPVTSLAALVYTATVDRGTRGWLLKTIVATFMFLIWLCVIGLLFG